MDQRPLPGSAPLTTPTSDVAQAYLHEAAAIEQRREARVDRRAMGWLDIVSGVVVGGYVMLALNMLRGDADARFPLLIVPMLLWTQLSIGLQERGGAQRRPSGPVLWGWIALIVLLGGSFAATAVLLFFDLSLPDLFFFLPGTVVFVVFSIRGIRQLMRARRQPATTRPPRRALSRVESIGTVVIGLVMGVTIAVAAAPFDVVRSVAGGILMLGLAVWTLSFSTPWGLPHIGAVWRWQHWALMAVSAAVAVVVIASPASRDLVSWAAFGAAGAVIALLFIALSSRGMKGIS